MGGEDALAAGARLEPDRAAYRDRLALVVARQFRERQGLLQAFGGDDLSFAFAARHQHAGVALLEQQHRRQRKFRKALEVNLYAARAESGTFGGARKQRRGEPGRIDRQAGDQGLCAHRLAEQARDLRKAGRQRVGQSFGGGC